MSSDFDAPAVGLSLMMQDDFREASRPLFEAGSVDVVEWSFDIGWGQPMPAWLEDILQSYSRRNSLLGHGVSYSVLDASQTARQQHWLQQLQVELCGRRYRHVSEHFGFMGGGNFHLSSPLPVPRTPASLAVGQERLRQLAEVSRLPVGLENLAFAFNEHDIRQQGPFLDELLQPVDGFLLLDLHNLYCHSRNFDVDMLELLEGYPLDRVREVHVSGGSWDEPIADAKPVRRDTHDDSVPDEIFAVLPAVLQRCPHLRFVILERMGGTIDVSDSEQVDGFRQDFLRLKQICKAGHDG